MDNLEQAIAAAHQRWENLSQRASETENQNDDPELLPAAMAEIASSLEELYVLEEELKQQKKEKHIQKQQEYNNTYGYTDNLKPCQKGRILKILNKEFNYYDYGTLKRKDFILKVLKEGYKPQIKDKIVSSIKKVKGKRQEKYKYNVPVIEKDNKFYEITKTEYDYAMYLLEEVI